MLLTQALACPTWNMWQSHCPHFDFGFHLPSESFLLILIYNNSPNPSEKESNVLFVIYSMKTLLCYEWNQLDEAMKTMHKDQEYDTHPALVVFLNISKQDFVWD